MVKNLQIMCFKIQCVSGIFTISNQKRCTLWWQTNHKGQVLQSSEIMKQKRIIQQVMSTEKKQRASPNYNENELAGTKPK